MDTGNSRVRYIAGRPLNIGSDKFEPGDTIPAAAIALIPYVESFTNSGHIYVVHGENGYEKLPPHIYGVVKTKREVEEAMAAEAPIELEQAKDAHEKHETNEAKIRSEAESIVARNSKDPSLSKDAERVLFTKGQSTVDPDKAEKEEAAAKEAAEKEQKPAPRQTQRKTTAKK